MSIVQTKIASIIMALAVIFGAFGAHTMKALLSADRLQSWKTGVLYMLIHGLAMLILAISQRNLSGENQNICGLSFKLFLVGIFLFSGSIFLLSTQDILGINARWIGPITPIGGVLFIAGWMNILRFKG